ncbi:MAG: hypothetical protein ACRER4_01730 [Steroidobacteraceae bacterium]
MAGIQFRVGSVACAVVALVGASNALADAPCNKGFRNVTPAEHATITAALTAGKKALPPAPAGWVLQGDEQFSIQQSVCKDDELKPWNYSFTRYYRRTDDQAARDKMMEEAGAKSAAAYAAKQPRLDAIMARMTKLSERQVALVEKGDLAGATALNEDMAKIQEEYKKVVDEGDSEEQFQAAAAQASRDLEMTVGLDVNAWWAQTPGDSTQLPLPPGARSALRWNTTSGDVETAHAEILLGLWRPVASGGFASMSREGVSPSAAHTILIRVNADASRFESTIAAIDFAALAKLVPK